GVLQALRRYLKTESHRMSRLPQIAVAHRAVETKLGCVRAIPVVQLGAPMQRKAILDRELDVHCPGFNSRAQTRADPPVRQLIQGNDLPLNVVEVRDRQNVV